MKNFVKIFAINLILLGCTEKNGNPNEKSFTLDSFPVQKNLESKKYNFEEILTATLIAIKNDKLIISENYRGGSGPDRKLIHIIQKDSMRYLYPKGKQGYGPGEIISIRSFDQGWNDSTFWAYDLNEKNFHEYSLEDTLTTSIQTFKQSEQSFFAISWSWLTPDTFVGRMMNDSHAFAIYDTANVLQRKLDPWFEDKEVDEYQGYILGDIKQGQTAYNKDRKLLVHAQINSDIVEIIPVDSPSEKITISGPISEPLKYEIKGSGRNIGADIFMENTLAYNNVFLGKESIFLVYLGYTRAESINRESKLSNEIFELDYQGNPIAYYQLDRQIYSIAVDEEERKIYAVTYDEDPGVAVFEY
ncbi:BF3164 family lipoprotein [Indibacter alkaliphilus]|uniref:BF3164 family lipoprotein n=1 Tax=Indibacter alkaliphilus TaxID=579922 RepID=UPI001268C996|nr:BF3164 family lipoprotein [Indibacter alkaliphilus]